MKKSFVVTIDVPSQITDSDIIEYIDEAVASWCGGFNPTDPLFHLYTAVLEVRLARESE